MKNKSFLTDGFTISLNRALALLLPVCVILIPLADVQPDPLFRKRLILLIAIFYAVAAGAWASSRIHENLGKGILIAALLSLFHVGLVWRFGPGFLNFLVLPVLMGMLLVHVFLGIVIAGVETALLIAARPVIAPNQTGTEIFVMLIVLWVLVAAVYHYYSSANQISNWSWKYYQEGLAVKIEAREQRLQQEQMVKDLAQANLQLKRLNNLAQNLRQAAEDARTAKEQFVANVSHELRTPLNMIIGFSEMIIKNPGVYRAKIPASLLADLTVINRNAEHLSELINDVLDLSQIDADRMALTKERVRIEEIVNSAVIAVRPLFESKGLCLRTSIPEDIPPLFCDRTRIREVLLNLLSNAGRFTEKGGVDITVEVSQNNLTVSVADTGHGISPENLELLFQPFQQIDGSIRRQYGGTGLGLSISKRFVELHDGKMWVESQVGQGTTFFFRLPLLDQPAVSGGVHRWLTPGWEFFQRTHAPMTPEIPLRPRYVILERGNALQRLLQRYMDGIEIISAETLDQAVKKLAEAPSKALLINHMSVGLMLENIRGSEMINDTPTIICDLPDMYEADISSHVVDYLIKPVTSEMIHSALDRLDLPEGNTILIVDDEPELLRLFRRMLLSYKRNYRVLSAVDGRQALDILHQEKVDLVMLDLVMPNIDGFNLIKMKDSDPELADIPAIIISARDPIGQPIVSRSLALTVPGGLSVPRLLTCIETLSQILSETGQPAGRAQLKKLPD